jgi:hypothetical protein
MRIRLLIIALLPGLAGTLRAAGPPEITTGVAIQADGLSVRQAELAKAIASGPARAMKGYGLAGVAGGAHVRVLSDKPQEVVLPIPQLADAQVPLCYFIEATPADAVAEFRLRTREDGNVVVGIRLAGKKQDVQLAWSAVVLIAPKPVAENRTPPEPYRKATPCVQAGADEVTKRAAALWPKSGKAADFAANIQAHVRDMKRAERPASLDAVGILKSGENGICTANANLAAALMRAKGIACRSVAVVAPIGQRLEMHRIVEFADGDRWVPFDPSGLSADVPARPWQNVVMAKTTIQDEERAMTPRMGAMRGCPYGQEAELLTADVTLFGEDFFWTQATPLAEFEPTEESVKLAAKAWAGYLETGKLTAGQLKAASATTAAELAAALKAR